MFTTTSGRLRPIWAFLLAALFSVAANILAADLAGAVAGSRSLVFEVLFRPLLALFLLALFLWMLKVADHVEHDRLGALGLPRVAGALRQFADGCVLGAGLIVLAIMPIAIWGRVVSIRFHFTPLALARVAGVLTMLVFGALAEELMFRGYPFQRLEEAVGAAGAILVFSALFGLAHLWNPAASRWGLVNTVLIGIVLAVAYLRTRSLWMPWGLHFAWNTTLGLLLGLPVSGLRVFNVAVRITVTGPLSVTGGAYGVEASAGGAVAVLIGLTLVSVLPLRRLETAVSAVKAPHPNSPLGIEN